MTYDFICTMNTAKRMIKYNLNLLNNMTHSYHAFNTHKCDYLILMENA